MKSTPQSSTAIVLKKYKRCLRHHAKFIRVLDLAWSRFPVPSPFLYAVMISFVAAHHLTTVSLPDDTADQAEARMSTFEPSISRGTKSLVRKRPDLQAPFEQRRAIMEVKRQERERLRQAARVGGFGSMGGWTGSAIYGQDGQCIRKQDQARLSSSRGTMNICAGTILQSPSLPSLAAAPLTPSCLCSSYINLVGQRRNKVVQSHHSSENRRTTPTANAAEAGRDGGREGEEDGERRRPTQAVCEIDSQQVKVHGSRVLFHLPACLP